MKNFRLPRKTKKKLGKKFFLYPPDAQGNRQMAFPKRSQKYYDAVKSGLAKNLFLYTKAERKARHEEFKEKYLKPVSVSEEKLKKMVNKVFAEEFRYKAYMMLLRAQKHPVAFEQYYIFVNAFNLNEHNTAAMCYDGLIEKLKNPKYKKRK